MTTALYWNSSMTVWSIYGGAGAYPARVEIWHDYSAAHEEGPDGVRQSSIHIPRGTCLQLSPLKVIILALTANGRVSYPRRSGVSHRNGRHMIFVVRRLHRLARKNITFFYTHFGDIAKFIRFRRPSSLSLLWTVLPRFGVPPNVLAVTFHVHDGMRARIRTRYSQSSTFQRA